MSELNLPKISETELINNTVKNKTVEDEELDIESKNAMEIMELLFTEKPKYNKVSDIIFSNLMTIYDELLQGCTLSNIARRLGLNPQALYKLKRENELFKKFLIACENEKVERVINSLYSKASDKYVTAQKVTQTGKVVDYEKYVPADFQAIKFFLLNHCPTMYKDKQEIEIRKTDIVIDIIDVEAEEV